MTAAKDRSMSYQRMPLKKPSLHPSCSTCIAGCWLPGLFRTPAFSVETAATKSQRLPARECVRDFERDAWAPAIQFCQQVLGVDRVLYAMDYPYQFEAGEVVEMDAVGTDLERRKFYELNARAVFDI